MSDHHPRQIIRELIDRYGSQRALAGRLGVSEASVSHWVAGRHQPGPDVCVVIEQQCEGVTRGDVRPDLFGEG